MNPLAYFAATAIVWLIASAAARLRFSAPHRLRLAVDILFLLSLALPAPLVVSTAIHCPDVSVEDLFAAIPLFYLCALMGFRRVEAETVEAARLQGLGRCGIFWRVYFPAAWPWLTVGLALGCFRSGILLALIHA